MTTVHDVMTTDLVSCPSHTPISDAARLMRDHAIGDVLVTSDGTLRGIVTDRDLVVRCLADGVSTTTPVGEACSGDLVAMSPTTSLDEAAQIMRERSLRRLPVVADGEAIGIVTLGDLAMNRDPASALSEISSAAPNT
jgi:CBS domain-containing protein